MKAIRFLDEHLEEILLCILLAAISCVELVQVIFRNVPSVNSLTWAEEFCRFCWIWSVFLSLPYTIKKAGMLRVSALLDALPSKLRGLLDIFADFFVTAIMLILGISSVGVVRGIMESGETSPAMLIPMYIIYSIMLAGFFLGTLRGIQKMYEHIRRLHLKGQVK